MELPSPADGYAVLNYLSNVVAILHQGMEYGTSRSREFFDSRHADVDIYLAPALVRYHVKEFLALKGIETQDLANNGLALVHSAYHIRVLKEDVMGQLPSPGHSTAKQRFYQQEPLFDGAISLNLIVLWRVDSAYRFRGLLLISPKYGDAKRFSAEQNWLVPVPDPILTITTDQVDSELDDLDITKSKTHIN